MADKYAELRDSLEKNTRWINVTMDGKYSLFDIETIRALLAERDALREALKRCRFDSLNMTLEDMDFIRAALAQEES